jgi:hypothetical protein
MRGKIKGKEVPGGVKGIPVRGQVLCVFKIP